MDLAVNLVDQYLAFVQHWQWGDSILEWIRRCATTFDLRVELRNLLRAELWPHAGRSSFVTLLEDKSVETGGVGIEKAMGMRLTFREPPPLKCFSNQFLFYLNSSVANSAYQTWSQLTSQPDQRPAAGALSVSGAGYELGVAADRFLDNFPFPFEPTPYSFGARFRDKDPMDLTVSELYRAIVVDCDSYVAGFANEIPEVFSPRDSSGLTVIVRAVDSLDDS